MNVGEADEDGITMSRGRHEQGRAFVDRTAEIQENRSQRVGLVPGKEPETSSIRCKTVPRRNEALLTLAKEL
jgi:hypothetical protein